LIDDGGRQKDCVSAGKALQENSRLRLDVP
jgi:hypothetical protein